MKTIDRMILIKEKNLMQKNIYIYAKEDIFQ